MHAALDQTTALDQTGCSFDCWGKSHKDGPHLHGHGVSGEHAVPDAVCIPRLEPAHRKRF